MEVETAESTDGDASEVVYGRGYMRRCMPFTVLGTWPLVRLKRAYLRTTWTLGAAQETCYGDSFEDFRTGSNVVFWNFSSSRNAGRKEFHCGLW